MNINWEKSYRLTAEQVSLLGLDGRSVHEMAHTHPDDVSDLARLADAMQNLTVEDIKKYANDMLAEGSPNE